MTTKQVGNVGDLRIGQWGAINDIEVASRDIIANPRFVAGERANEHLAPSVLFNASSPKALEVKKCDAFTLRDNIVGALGLFLRRVDSLASLSCLDRRNQQLTPQVRLRENAA